ncbi:Adenine phosphoribosyltransferase [Thalictrum thalictroides]|uniref:adenine phosphoribosyltransferase n=1 Tax=Thalictrum thalictroides TaxID=46969 RepID=A0A7J6WBR6_THATH|nr:Adenine phosphoribosyltransferase [Thalictrum thalictroides]
MSLFGTIILQGIEARGFIFGPPIALAIGAKFVPMRKPRKLPGEVISEEYVLEYGTDCLEMHIGAVEPNERVLVVDDLVATGGTLRAAIRLLERVGAEVVECACVIELPELKCFAPFRCLQYSVVCKLFNVFGIANHEHTIGIYCVASKLTNITQFLTSIKVDKTRGKLDKLLNPVEH